MKFLSRFFQHFISFMLENRKLGDEELNHELLEGLELTLKQKKYIIKNMISDDDYFDLSQLFPNEIEKIEQDELLSEEDL